MKRLLIAFMLALSACSIGGPAETDWTPDTYFNPSTGETLYVHCSSGLYTNHQECYWEVTP